MVPESYENLPSNRVAIKSLDKTKQEEYRFFVIFYEPVSRFPLVDPLMHDESERIGIAQQYFFQKSKFTTLCLEKSSTTSAKGIKSVRPPQATAGHHRPPQAIA